MSEQRFTTLYTDCYTRLYRYTVALTGDAETARDIVSDVIAALWQHLGEVEEAKLGAWLVTAARRRCIDSRRRALSHRRYAEQYLRDTEHSYCDEHIRERQDALVAEMLTHLNPLTANIVRLAYLDHTRRREVAERLALSESTVKKHISVAFKTLRRAYADGDVCLAG